MNKEKHFTSRMLICAGALMTVSGILTAMLGKLAIGGIFWAAASGMFFAAYHFRLAEKKLDETEESENEQKTL